MSRRTRLPGAEELFRSTGHSTRTAQSAAAGDAVPLTRAEEMLADKPSGHADGDGVGSPAANSHASATGRTAARTSSRRRGSRSTLERRPSGRERHDEKITVYVSADELMDLEQARLTLRGEHGVVVDRGRIVREALAFVLADLDAKGYDSILVRRVRGR